MSILFINACVRGNSRTHVLASKIVKDKGKKVEEIVLEKLNLKPLDKKRLEKRDFLIQNGKFNDDFFQLANQFKNAEEIVIAAPFWDLGFPSLLKIYLENVTVSGITFSYDNGRPVGLCKAKKLTYITTSGGKIFQDFGYSYVKALALNFYGIKDVECYRVENLDVKCVQAKDVLNEDIILIK